MAIAYQDIASISWQDIVTFMTVPISSLVSSYNIPSNIDFFIVRFSWNLYTALCIGVVVALQDHITNSSYSVAWIEILVGFYMPVVAYFICLILGVLGLGFAAFVPVSALLTTGPKRVFGSLVAIMIQLGVLGHALTVATIPHVVEKANG